MEKIIMVLSLFTFSLWANTEMQTTKTLEETCLSCHAQQQIPNGLIYKRYLMQYSTDRRMEKAMFKYLKNPNKKTSIMPPQFFLKFPMKEKLDIDDKTLQTHIQNYLKKFDIRKHIIIEK
jgi:cytochrome c1